MLSRVYSSITCDGDDIDNADDVVVDVGAPITRPYLCRCLEQNDTHDRPRCFDAVNPQMGTDLLPTYVTACLNSFLT